MTHPDPPAMTHPDPPAVPVAATALTVGAGDLASVLASVLPHTSRDRALPHLCSVLLEVERGTLTAVATNGYTLATDTVSTSSRTGEPFRFLVDCDDAAQVVRTAKLAAKHSGNVTLTPEPGATYGGARWAETLTVSVPLAGVTLGLLTTGYDFPDWRGFLPEDTDVQSPTAARCVARPTTDRCALCGAVWVGNEATWPEHDERTGGPSLPGGQFAVSAKWLKALAESARAVGDDVVHWQYTGWSESREAPRLARVRIGETFRAAVMPVKA